MWEVGSEPSFMTPLPVDPVDPVDRLPCRKVVFRLYETLTFENRVLKVIVTLRRFGPDMPQPMCFHRERKGQQRERFIIVRQCATVWT